MVGATASGGQVAISGPTKLVQGAGLCKSQLGAAHYKSQSFTEAPSFLINTFIPLSS